MKDQHLYRVQLLHSTFRSKCVCLGDQMERIVRAINSLCPECYWSYSDVRTNRYAGLIETAGVHRSGRTVRLLQQLTGVDQLESGVFWAGRSPDTLLRKYPGEYPNPETEDPAFSPMGEACVEVRAFDTTMFEVYFQDIELAEHFATNFQVRVESAPPHMEP